MSDLCKARGEVMGWPRKDEKAQEMYLMYLNGLSLSEVAKAFASTRQSVFEMFKNRGLNLREKKFLPFVEFNGAKYTLRNTGYYGKTDGKRTLLHRDMWEFHKGPIPDGFDVHHVDENKEHNEISNFECLLKADHTRLHPHGQNQYTKRREQACG
jgi:hypothetical protein